MQISKIVSETLTNLSLETEYHEEVIGLLEKKIIKKGQYFIHEDTPAKVMGILIEGMLEAKYYNKESKPFTANFYYPNGTILVSDYRSFIDNYLAQENIIALEDTLIMVLQKKDFDILYKKYDAIKEVSKRLLDQNFLLAVKRIRYFQMYNKEERVKQFIEKHPEIFQKAERQSVASFLGMHRNSLLNLLEKK